MTSHEDEVGPISARGMLTVSEVAHILHVHPNTVRLWSNKGLLKAHRLGRRNDRRFNPDDIEEYVNKSPHYRH